jgi:hypothetical protein
MPTTPTRFAPCFPGTAGCLALITSRDPLAGLIATNGADGDSLTWVMILPRVLGESRTACDVAMEHLPSPVKSEI